ARGGLPAEPGGLPAGGVAPREDGLCSWRPGRGAGRAWLPPPPLAAAGADLAWCERAAAVLDGPALEAGLEWVASTFSVAALLTELKESSRRISDLVAAIKSYSQMDRASLQLIDVTDGLESTVTVLGPRLRDRV